MAFGTLLSSATKSGNKLITKPKLEKTRKFTPPVSPVEGSPRPISPTATRGATSGVAVQGYSATNQNSNILRNTKTACRDALDTFEKLAKHLEPEELEQLAAEVIEEVLQKSK